MENKQLNSDNMCRVFQKMYFDSQFTGQPVNMSEPRTAPGEHLRDDGVLYVNDICYNKDVPNSFLDIYYPNEKKDASLPTVIYIHGGGFIFGDKVSGDPLAKGSGGDTDFCAEIAKRGYNVVSPNYALAPEYRFPVQIRQLDALLAFLCKSRDALFLNTDCIFLGGGSAGACLSEIYGALLCNPAYCKEIGVTPSIQREQIAALLIDESGLVAKNFEEKMNAMFGCWLGEDAPSENEEALRKMEAARWIGDAYLPSYIIASNEDPFFKDSAEALVEALERNHTDYVYYYRGKECDALEHGFLKRYETNKYARECMDGMLAFMENHAIYLRQENA